LPPRYADWATQAGLPRPPQKVSSTGNSASAALQTRSPEDVDTAAGTARQTLRIVAPSDGVKLLRDTSLPPSRNTIGLRVEITPPMREVLWLVDGKPYQMSAYPYTVRWTLQPGEHVIQARSPFTSEISQPVRIRVE
jgi:Penicillin-Binding Protein C-terminus Family